jgi:hypothetical protein
MLQRLEAFHLERDAYGVSLSPRSKRISFGDRRTR